MLDVMTRNELLLQYEPVVRWTIKHNWTLICALHLDADDVYQDLCITMMKAIDGFDPQRSDSLKTHIISRLQYEVKNFKRRYKPHGMTGARRADVVFCSLDYKPENYRHLEIPVEASYDLVEFAEAMALLSREEKTVVEERIEGVHHRAKAQQSILAAAQQKLSQYYERSAIACY